MADDRLIVAALLRKSGQTLLVQENTAGNDRPEWSLPGGTAEPDELLLECLQRVVREDTGLEVVRVGELISLTQSLRPSSYGASSSTSIQPRDRTTVFTFEVAEWRGEIHQNVAEGSAKEARFWPTSAAIEHLERIPRRVVSEPIVAYLRGERADRAWFYRLDAEGQDDLVWPEREPPLEVSEQIRRTRAIVTLGCIALLAILIIIVIIGIITLARPFV